jgi:hypothetical protein
MVADPHHFNGIRILLVTLMRIRIRIYTFMRIRILLLIKMMRICDHWSTDSQRLHDPPWLNSEPLQLLSFELNADPDPDPVMRIRIHLFNENPCESGSPTLPFCMFLHSASAKDMSYVLEVILNMSKPI